jgi:peptidoglycan/LPS O-acetylase OafA/YrhL
MRFNNLTVARFAAALLVFLHHSSPVEYAALGSPFWKQFYANGFVGVSFFFVLSGFVLAASSWDKFAAPTMRDVGEFYWKRIARIVPLWLLVSSPWIYKAAVEHDPMLLPFVTFTQAWSPDAMVAFGLLGVSWTLSVEMFFYLLFPPIAIALNRLRQRRLGGILIAVGLAIPVLGAAWYLQHPDLAALPFLDPASPHRWLLRFPPARLGEFLAGIGIFLALRQARNLRAMPAVLLLAAATAGLVYVMGTLEEGGVYWVAPYALLFAVIVFALAQLDLMGLTTRNRFLLLLGEASFAFYLVHQFFFKAALLPPLHALFGLPVAQPAILVLAVATSIGLYTGFEVPMRELLHKLLRRRAPVYAPTEPAVDSR